jgi:hypothetical protein
MSHMTKTPIFAIGDIGDIGVLEPGVRIPLSPPLNIFPNFSGLFRRSGCSQAQRFRMRFRIVTPMSQQFRPFGILSSDINGLVGILFLEGARCPWSVRMRFFQWSNFPDVAIESTSCQLFQRRATFSSRLFAIGVANLLFGAFENCCPSALRRTLRSD